MIEFNEQIRVVMQGNEIQFLEFVLSFNWKKKSFSFSCEVEWDSLLSSPTAAMFKSSWHLFP